MLRLGTADLKALQRDYSVWHTWRTSLVTKLIVRWNPKLYAGAICWSPKVLLELYAGVPNGTHPKRAFIWRNVAFNK